MKKSENCDQVHLSEPKIWYFMCDVLLLSDHAYAAASGGWLARCSSGTRVSQEIIKKTWCITSEQTRPYITSRHNTHALLLITNSSIFFFVFHSLCISPSQRLALPLVLADALRGVCSLQGWCASCAFRWTTETGKYDPDKKWCMPDLQVGRHYFGISHNDLYI